MVTVLRVLDIMVGVIYFHLLVGAETWSIEVGEDALLDLRWRTLQSREDFVHSSGSPEDLLPFFWVVNVSFTNVAA